MSAKWPEDVSTQRNRSVGGGDLGNTLLVAPSHMRGLISTATD